MNDMTRPDGSAEEDRERTTAKWTPASSEGLCVSRIVHRSIADVERALRIRPEKLVRAAYDCKIDAKDGAVVPLFLVSSQRWFRVPVRVGFWSPTARSGAVISLRWQATHLTRYFPVLEADLAARPSAGVTVLELNGTYRPPLKIAGLIFDYFVGKRIATATAVGFVDALASAIERDELGETGTQVVDA